MDVNNETELQELIVVKESFKQNFYQQIKDGSIGSASQLEVVFANAYNLDDEGIIQSSPTVVNYITTINNGLEELVYPDDMLPEIASDRDLTDDEKILLTEYIASVEILLDKIGEINTDLFQSNDAPSLKECKEAYVENSRQVCIDYGTALVAGGILSGGNPFVLLAIAGVAYYKLDSLDREYNRCVKSARS